MTKLNCERTKLQTTRIKAKAFEFSEYSMSWSAKTTTRVSIALSFVSFIQITGFYIVFGCLGILC